MTAIFIGILLTAINLNVGLIGYFLPALGLMLIYTQLRNYRQLNRSFIIADHFVIAMLLCEAVILFVIATPLNLSDFINVGIMVATTALLTCFLFCFMKGIQEEYKRKGDLEFKGSSVVGAAASKILLIVFLISGFKLGAAICGLTMVVFLVGVGLRLHRAEVDLNLKRLTPASVKVSSKVMWGGYTLLVVTAVFGGMFLGTMTFGQEMIEGAAKSSSVAVLTERGMPKVIAQDLSDRDAKALAAAESFAEIKSSGENHAEVRLIGGMTGKNDYKLILWYGDLNGGKSSSYLSREIVEVSRTEPIKSCAGTVYYTKDGKEFSAKISAVKVSINEGKMLIREVKEIDAAEILYTEIPLRNGADAVRGYLILEGRFNGTEKSGSIYTELYDVNIVQFPYKNAKQTIKGADEADRQRSCTFTFSYQLK